MLVTNKHSVLLTGNRAVGKTILIQDVLRRLGESGGCNITKSSILGSVLSPSDAKTSLLPKIGNSLSDFSISNDHHSKMIGSQITFSALTGADKPKEAIQSKLVKRGRDVLGSRNGENVILFVDDMNMPKPDKYGSQATLEVLREYLNYGGFYGRKHLRWKEICDVTLLSSCTLSRQSIRNSSVDRIHSNFNTLCLVQPSAKSLHHIYVTQLGNFLDSNEFHGEVRGLKSCIISSILGIYHNISITFKTTPQKSHYLFNFRDISKVVKGLFQADPTEMKSKDNLVSLLIHESSRVFLDRLICENERILFYDILAKQLHDFLKTKSTAEMLMTHCIAFGDFFEPGISRQERVYKSLSDKAKLMQIIEDYYYRGKILGSGIPDNMVFFSGMYQHIVSAARVLRQPEGHLLLLGVGGTGKRSSVQLASFMEQCDFFETSFTRNYAIADFKEDIKNVMITAGVKGISTVFFLKDMSMTMDSFLEVICFVITTSDLSMFLENEAKESIVADLRSEALSSGVTGNPVEIFKFFQERVKSNLHIVYSATPSGPNFTKRCTLFPTLLNNFIIDWYDKWPEQALHIVSNKFLEDEEFTEEVKESVTEIFVYAYGNVDVMCQRFYDELKRSYHITPKTFLDFIFLFKRIYVVRQKESCNKRDRLLSGLNKLEVTNTMIVEMKAELTELGPKLEQKANDTNKLVDKILKDEYQLNKVKAVVNKEQEVTDNEARKIEVIAADAERDLENALPQLEEATAALDSLNKYDIGEIRSYANPPTMVMTVLSAVCVVLNEKPDWATAKLLLGDPGFLKKLINYDHQNMSDKVYSQLKKYSKNPEFNPLTVGKISGACKSMCSWVLALVNYTAVYRSVLPKKIKCEEAQKALVEAKKELVIKQASLRKVEEQFTALEKRYQDNLKQLKEFEYTKQLTIKRLEKAALLIVALTNEKDRWMKVVANLEKESIYHLSESILAAAATSFLGPFTPTYRSSFVNSLMGNIESHNIDMKPNFDLVSSMSNVIEVQDWINSALPADTHSVENALFIKNTRQWPFIIDPQYQALKWIKKKERNFNLHIVKVGSPKLTSVLENCIRLGEVVIIMQNVDHVPIETLSTVLTKQEDQSVVTIGGKEVTYNDNFQLYIITDVANPKLLPELCIRVTVINFIITMHGLTDQVLSKIVQQENPELEASRKKVLEFVVEERLSLTNLENHSLNLLHNSQGNILDDEDLIQTLDNSRTIAEGIKQRVEEAEEAKSKISEKRKVYLRLAERGALLYFVAQDLSAVDSVYQFSLAWFINLFCQCIMNADNAISEKKFQVRPSSAKSRLTRALQFASYNTIVRRRVTLINSIERDNKSSYIDVMIRHITETFYRVVSYALLARHQQLFSFYLTIRILLQEKGEGVGMVSPEEYHILLKGKNNDFSHTNNTSGKINVVISAEKQTEEKSTQVVHSTSLLALSQSQWDECFYLTNSLVSFTGLCDHLKTHADWWNKFLCICNPLEYLEDSVNVDSNDSLVFKVRNLSKFQRLLLIKVLRGDKFTDAISSFISSTMGVELNSPHGCNLEDVYTECDCKTPVLFILTPGCDPLSRLMSFVKEVRGSILHLDIISLGRGQGPRSLEKIRNGFTRKGSWVFLQNCHLALSFLPDLDEIVRELSDVDVEVNPQFRLWLSTEAHPLIPPSILQSSMKVTVEPPPGVKNNLQNTFKSVGGLVTENQFENTVHENWKQLIYSVCFFHAVIQERWKFGAFGWNVPYRFIASDLNTAIMTLQDIMEKRAHIPWHELQLLTGEIIYGGRVRNRWDERCLCALVKRFYTSDLIKRDFSYFGTNLYSPPPVDASFYDCLLMIDKLPAVDLPEIFGMNENAMFESCRGEGVNIISQLNTIQPSHVAMYSSTQSSDEFAMKRAKEIQKLLPRNVHVAKQAGDCYPPRPPLATQHSIAPRSQTKVDMKQNKFKRRSKSIISLDNPAPIILPIEAPLDEETTPCALSTTLGQEKRRFDHLLNTINENLHSLGLALNGDILITDKLRNISHSIVENKVPSEWQLNLYNSHKSLSSWLKNLQKRIKFLSLWIQSLHLKDPIKLREPCAIWLPAFFYPQGILTAILQNHARQNKLHIDELCYDHSVTNFRWISDMGDQNDIDPCDNALQGREPPSTGIYIFGLFLDGACWDYKCNFLAKLPFGQRMSPLPVVHFIPQNKTKVLESRANRSLYECPLYQTSKRRDDFFSPNFVTSIFLPTEIDPDDWVLNGIAALCQPVH